MRVLFGMDKWNKPSELFLMREIQMLYDASMLAGIVVADDRNTLPSSWNRTPVYRLQPENTTVYRALKKLGHRPKSHSAKFTDILAKVQPDAVLLHYTTLAVNVALALESENIPVFVHAHGYDTYEHIISNESKTAFEQLTRAANVIVISNSYDTFERLKSWNIPPNCHVVKYLGVEVPDQPIEHGDKEEVTILHLGRLVDFKSPDRTIQAFEVACQRGLNGRLVIGGDGELRTMCELLRARSQWKDRIVLLGAVPWEDGDKLRREADIFTHHSVLGELSGRVETFGVSIVEAMAAGLPVVTCKVGGIAETVIDNETGIFFPSGDIEAQADAFLKLANNRELRAKMGQAGWKRAKEHFSYEREKEQLLHILRNPRQSG